MRLRGSVISAALSRNGISKVLNDCGPLNVRFSSNNGAKADIESAYKWIATQAMLRPAAEP